ESPSDWEVVVLGFGLGYVMPTNLTLSAVALADRDSVLIVKRALFVQANAQVRGQRVYPGFVELPNLGSIGGARLAGHLYVSRVFRQPLSRVRIQLPVGVSPHVLEEKGQRQ